MKEPNGITRRRFLGAIAASGVACAGGLLPVGGCATTGARGGTLRIVFYSDVHARLEWETPLALERAAHAINARRPDLVFAGGDLVTDGFQSSYATVGPRWDLYMNFHRSIEAEVHPVLGNHDLVAAIPEDGSEPSPDPRAVFRDKFGLERTYRSFDALGTHFVLLDSVQITGGPLEYNGLIWAEELEWLKQDLSSVPRGAPIVVVVHIPLLTAFYGATQGASTAAPANRVVVNNREVLALLADHNLVLVLQGHSHAKELLQWQDTTFLTGGAICGKWWRGSWFGTEEGFCVVELRPDRVDWEYVDYGWQAQRPTNA